jgi:hypothetical protein
MGTAIKGTDFYLRKSKINCNKTYKIINRTFGCSVGIKLENVEFILIFYVHVTVHRDVHVTVHRDKFPYNKTK